MNIELYLEAKHLDLVTPDGIITNLSRIDEKNAEALVFINHISPIFVGFHIDISHVFFNIKSTLAQLELMVWERIMYWTKKMDAPK